MSQMIIRSPSRLLGLEWRAVGLVLAWTIIFGSLPKPATGECINTIITTRQALRQASLVFQGKVVEIEDAITQCRPRVGFSIQATAWLSLRTNCQKRIGYALACNELVRPHSATCRLAV